MTELDIFCEVLKLDGYKFVDELTSSDLNINVMVFTKHQKQSQESVKIYFNIKNDEIVYISMRSPSDWGTNVPLTPDSYRELNKDKFRDLKIREILNN